MEYLMNKLLHFTVFLTLCVTTSLWPYITKIDFLTKNNQVICILHDYHASHRNDTNVSALQRSDII